MPSLSYRFFRRAGLTLGILGPLAVLGVLGMAQDNKAPAPKAPTAKQKFKNIKVLKDLPADQLIPVMRAYNEALGVKCDFCHVINPDHSGFDQDTKPAKEAARKMVTMVIDMNRRHKVLGNRATCMMCHRGHPEPEMGSGGHEERR